MSELPATIWEWHLLKTDLNYFFSLFFSENKNNLSVKRLKTKMHSCKNATKPINMAKYIGKLNIVVKG